MIENFIKNDNYKNFTLNDNYMDSIPTSKYPMLTNIFKFLEPKDLNSCRLAKKFFKEAVDGAPKGVIYKDSDWETKNCYIQKCEEIRELKNEENQTIKKLEEMSKTHIFLQLFSPTYLKEESSLHSLITRNAQDQFQKKTELKNIKESTRVVNPSIQPLKPIRSYTTNPQNIESNRGVVESKPTRESKPRASTINSITIPQNAETKKSFKISENVKPIVITTNSQTSFLNDIKSNKIFKERKSQIDK